MVVSPDILVVAEHFASMHTICFRNVRFAKCSLCVLLK